MFRLGKHASYWLEGSKYRVDSMIQLPTLGHAQWSYQLDPLKCSLTPYSSQFFMLNTNLKSNFDFELNRMTSRARTDFHWVDHCTVWSILTWPPSFLALTFICQKMCLDEIYVWWKTEIGGSKNYLEPEPEPRFRLRFRFLKMRKMRFRFDSQNTTWNRNC